jgi:hypothetical protein
MAGQPTEEEILMSRSIIPTQASERAGPFALPDYVPRRDEHGCPVVAGYLLPGDPDTAAVWCDHERLWHTYGNAYGGNHKLSVCECTGTAADPDIGLYKPIESSTPPKFIIWPMGVLTDDLLEIFSADPDRNWHFRPKATIPLYDCPACSPLRVEAVESWIARGEREYHAAQRTRISKQCQRTGRDFGTAWKEHQAWIRSIAREAASESKAVAE